MKIIKTLLLLTLLFHIAMAPQSSHAGGKDSFSPFEADKLLAAKAPDFSLQDADGRTVSFSSFKGKVILLNFWATWCPPCKAEMPSMNRLYNSLKKRGLEIIAVSSDLSLSNITDFLAKNRVDFPVLHDEKKTVTLQYKVFSMPTTLLIDRSGAIVEKFYGEYDWTEPEVRNKIEKLL